MNFKKMLAILLAVCLALAVCACAAPVDNSTETSEPTEESKITESTEKQDDGKVTYTVRVVDEDGKPIVSGGLIQFCLDSCVPCALDGNGVASMSLTPANYKVTFAVRPNGYVEAGDKTTFYFEDGSYEMTIVMKPAA